MWNFLLVKVFGDDVVQSNLVPPSGLWDLGMGIQGRMVLGSRRGEDGVAGILLQLLKSLQLQKHQDKLLLADAYLSDWPWLSERDVR